MAAFNLRQSAAFRLRQLEEIESNGKTSTKVKSGEHGEKVQVQITESVDPVGNKQVIVTEISASKDGQSTESKKTTS